MKVLETVSFHIVKPCNMRCKFCYATFDDMHVKQLPEKDAFEVIKKLIDGGVKKITFAGGEPLLYKHLKSCIKYSKELGATTSIISNGSLLTKGWLLEMRPFLDWIGVSIDSLNDDTNAKIGRITKGDLDYGKLIENIKYFNYKLKINTVVNKHNCDEDLNRFITWAYPARWKVFQTLKVEGQNDKQFEAIKCSGLEYSKFINRHNWQPALVPEDNEAMTGSYLLIDPQGRLFENSQGKHTYSSPLYNNSLEKCLSEISLDREMFIKRGGIYNW